MADGKNLRLKAAMAGRGMTTLALAELTKINYTSLSQKINGKRDFDLAEVKRIKSAIGLTQEEFLEIFFGEAS